MRFPAPVSFRAQAFIIGAASLAVVALAALIVRGVVFTTETKLLGDALRRCETACRELHHQVRERAAYAGDPLEQLPRQALEISLKGITATVLEAFPGIKGGMYLPAEDAVAGYAYPTAEEESEAQPGLSGMEWDLVRTLAVRAAETEGMVSDSDWENQDLITVTAVRSNGMVLWTLLRVPVLRYPLIGSHRWWFVALGLSTLLGVGGIVSIWYRLHSGIRSIQQGLRRLEDDFSFRLPSVPGDLGRVARDINLMAERRMALEEKLRQQDRLAALGKVVSGLAHEVRNPLNSIKLTLQLLERRLKRGVAASTEVAECLQEIDRLDLMVERLLAFGRPVMTHRQLQDVAPVITQAVKMVHEPMRKKGVRIELRLPAKKLQADIDAPEIVQVLINLLLNAVDASPPAGLVTIEAAREEDRVSIRVTDRGSRIPDEVRPHVFDAYYTTKENGSGLGLAVSREIAANHGGSLQFESANSDTTFILTLPAERGGADEA
jgi:signal transduction histidine kinase